MLKLSESHVMPTKNQTAQSDQPVFCIKQAWVQSHPLSAQQRLTSDSLYTHAGLNLCKGNIFCWLYHAVVQLLHSPDCFCLHYTFAVCTFGLFTDKKEVWFVFVFHDHLILHTQTQGLCVHRTLLPTTTLTHMCNLLQFFQL